MLVVASVNYLEVAKRDVTDGHVKEAVGQIGFFVTLNRDRCSLIQLLGNPSADFIQFDAVQFAASHAFWHHTQKIARATRWLQHVARFKAHLLQRLIHGTDHHWRSIKRS